jgi:TPP-dependent 2-oxoacid decarboxylase
MDNYTKAVLKKIDKDVKKKFKASVLDIIEEPGNYICEEGSELLIYNVREFVLARIDEMIKSAKTKAKEFNDHAMKADDLTKRFSAYISAHARQSNVPFLKPAVSWIDYSNKDRFYLAKMDESVTDFLDRAIESSRFIIDLTRSLGEYTEGSWMFNGDKNYVVTIYTPRTSVSMLMASRNEISTLLTNSYHSIKGL